VTYDFKKGPEDFSWVTTELFDEELKEILDAEYAPDLLSIPGVYEILSEHFNNEVLTNLQRHREEVEADECDEEPADDMPEGTG
jgi:hypothetical protein